MAGSDPKQPSVPNTIREAPRSDLLVRTIDGLRTPAALRPAIHAGLTLREVSIVSAGTLSGGEPLQRRAPALEQSDDGQQNTEGDDGGKGRGGDGLGRVGGGEVRLGPHGNLLILNWTEWHWYCRA